MGLEEGGSACGHRSSGRSPRVNRASVHPASSPGHSDGEDLLGLEIEASRTRRFGKSAIGAPVPAQRGEGMNTLRL